MTKIISLHPDKVVHANGKHQSFSARWTELAAEAGLAVRTVDAYSPALFDELRDCDGFMWRFGYGAKTLRFAKRLLPAIEHGLGIPVFPSLATSWSFEDKIAQLYLLRAAGVSIPETHVFWDRETAEEFCRKARYPLVLKLSEGFQSANVRLLPGPEEAVRWVRTMFGPGTTSLDPQSSRARRALGRHWTTVRLLAGRGLSPGVQHGYFYVQEFLPGNEFDTRVTVIGDRAFAFRRFNRPNDFRASGSGRIDWDPEAIDLEAVRIAFSIARQLGTQSLAIDALRRGSDIVVGEISYTYASWAVEACPGHWVRLTNDGTLSWIWGRLAPEDAIFKDFVAEIERSGGRMQQELSP